MSAIELFMGEKRNLLSLQLVTGAAVSVTAIPVISRIFMDLNIVGSRFASLVLVTATLRNLFPWCVFGAAIGLVNVGNFNLLRIFLTVIFSFVILVLFFILTSAFVAKVNTVKYRFLFRIPLSLLVCISGFVLVLLATVLNIDILVWALLIGVVIGTFSCEFCSNERTHIKKVVLSSVVPFYFSVVGFKIDLIHHFDPVFFLTFFIFSIGILAVGFYICLKGILGDWLSFINFSIAMNTKGAIGIVLATVAFDSGVISGDFFTVLVLTAVFSTLLTACWLRYVIVMKWPLIRP